MSGQREPFLAWPGWKHLKLAAIFFLFGCLWFVLVYGGCDAITARRSTRFRIHFDWELDIPFVPETVLVYMSIYVLFLTAPFILRGRREFLALAVSLNVVILVSGFGFLLVPASLAFAPPVDCGAFPNLFRFADRLNLTYNLLPSLHVALSTVCITAFVRHAPRFVKCGLWIWALAIAASTLLARQHHVLDVVTGSVLALAAFKFIYLRSVKVAS